MGLTVKAASSEAADELKTRTKQLQRMAFTVLECAESIRAIKAAIAEGDELHVAQLYAELDDEEKHALNVAPTKGGIFTTIERETIRAAVYAAYLAST